MIDTRKSFERALKTLEKPGKLLKGLKYPGQAARYIKGDFFVDGEKIQRFFFDMERTEIREYIREIEENDSIKSGLRKEKNRVNPGNSTVREHLSYCVVLYILAREIQPRESLEVGVHGNLSTLYLLSALEKNGKGRLISIDEHDKEKEKYPGDWQLNDGREPGWIAPDDLKDRWELRRGDYRDLLEPVLEESDALGLAFMDEIVVDDPPFADKTASRNAIRKIYGNLVGGGSVIDHGLGHTGTMREFCDRHGLRLRSDGPTRGEASKSSVGGILKPDSGKEESGK